MNKIHVGVQKFIHSCVLGSVSNLNISAIEFGTFLKSIENREISFVCLPAFVKKKAKKKQKHNETDNNQGRKKKKEGRQKRVMYNKQDPQAKIAENQRFEDAFYKEFREGIEQSCMDNGTKMCNRLYGKGYCFEGCKRSHTKKNAAEQARWKIFLKEILPKWKVKHDNGDFARNGRS